MSKYKGESHTHFAKAKPAMMASTLAMSISSALVGGAYAEESNVNVETNEETSVVMDTLMVEGAGVTVSDNPYAEKGAPYKAKTLADVRRTRDIADTPQTITVLTKDQIEESGKTELKDILSAQPGITLGTGEGGNSFGDRYIIRGYEARSDVYTDGLRDPGLITRETFALEQIEITKGPSSTFAGRGSTGGAVNSVTKKASINDTSTQLDAGLGTDKFQRYTLDHNAAVNDDLAFRINGLYTSSDIPDREPASEERFGGLLSATYKATDNVELSADYYSFRSDDKTDPGTYLVDGKPDKNVKYVGQDGLDFQETEADIATFNIDVDMGGGTRLENKTRYGTTANDYAISVYSTRRSGLRTFTGWQENEYLGNQTNFILDADIAGMRNTIVVGAEFANEKVASGNYTVTTDSIGTINPYDPDNSSWVGSIDKNPKRTELELQTISAYLMDTITVNEDWEVFAGLRYDQFDYELWAAESTSRFGVVTPETVYDYDDGFFNGHLGLVYSPWENGNIYASWSTSSNINGGEADAGTSCGYGGLCTDTSGNYAADPEQSTNLEIGTKWNLMDDKLLATAAIFQITKDDVIESGVDSYQTGGSFNTGKNRVEGIELGLSGNITDKLSGQVGVAIMDSETLKSFNPENVGKPKANFADNSANVQLKYQLEPALALGGVVTYSSEIYGGQPDSAARETISLPSYTVVDLFATYKLNNNFNVRANLNNVADEQYYTAVYRGGSIVYIGDGRSADVTVSYLF
ncbi:TonB-dependent receptor [Alkalimarinus alittae]|uniref:TonB-dependent siderophore receptor n=1 Tax=Alkalimarinus alittae TaxID=2961619 RepID=A0ABY6MXQ0_9ALTE|nr:TonB-dependent siderophore receptor [Alkalimarinus alittae]UZE94564.1 TonB-dependent siderophore receptor [Alkalimarinus alittae]